MVETAVPVYGGYVENINASCTHSYVSISSVVTGAATNEALAENYAASYRRIQNLGNTRAACSLDSSTSSLGLSQGIILYNSSTANSIYEISGNNLYQKEINCLAETATVTISVMECY
ncbi:MAG: hypothetical protein U9O94_05200 [Nanoarchaeota archaeon]|nr:hypothetical protein [Nanoarchaeota archaeon]